jgi:phage baseplate assembly protein W
MAAQISRSFRDISLSFARNPVTNDILALRNEDAIKKAVINLVKTQIGERFFNPLLGTSTNSLLFELNTIEVSSVLEEQITTLLDNFEPRIRVRSIVVSSIDDTNELNVIINYDIVGLPFPPQNIEFILQPTRI